MIVSTSMEFYIPISFSRFSDNEDLEAYVKEVTTELASEIKSEIRGVISKVEDVLDNSSENPDLSIYNMSSFTNLSRWVTKCVARCDIIQHFKFFFFCCWLNTFSADELRNDSVSASDVAEYLKEFSKGITSQVTSEIREIVNVMNETEHDFQTQRLVGVGVYFFFLFFIKECKVVIHKGASSRKGRWMCCMKRDWQCFGC